MSKKPIFLISGGPSTAPEQLAADYRAAFAAGSVPAPRVAYVGTASGDSKRFFGHLRAPMLAAGAASVELVPLASAQADVEAAKKMLLAADAVFLTGGEVEDGIVWIDRHGLRGFFRELYEQGKLFFGISAGCIMMGQHWVHWDVEDDDSTASLFPCLGFLPTTFDAHAEDEDWKELKCALRLLGPGAEGFGLADGGFFRGDPDGALAVLGKAPALYRNDGGQIVRFTR